jgi:hypothetical protein
VEIPFFAPFAESFASFATFAVKDFHRKEAKIAKEDPALGVVEFADLRITARAQVD